MSTYAIVGLSCLFPGARTPAEFWHNLRAGADSRREGGQEVFGTSPEEQDLDPQHEIYCRRGGFVTGFDFDPGGYRLDPGHLARLDRLFHWSLHVTREALRDSGHAERPGVLARAGLVLGNYSFPTPTSAKMSVPLAQEAVLEGLRRAGLPELAGLPPGAPLVDEAPLTEENLRVSGSPAGVTATALGLGGPRYALDAACSSALYALKLACDHLATGQADLMLAGGVRPRPDPDPPVFLRPGRLPARWVQPALRPPLRRHPHRAGRGHGRGATARGRGARRRQDLRRRRGHRPHQRRRRPPPAGTAGTGPARRLRTRLQRRRVRARGGRLRGVPCHRYAHR
ncbi:beta-ketoacyl synthase N-terminal-like domain-containing protein [Streptomyces indonesiensis]